MSYTVIWGSKGCSTACFLVFFKFATWYLGMDDGFSIRIGLGHCPVNVVCVKSLSLLPVLKLFEFARFRAVPAFYKKLCDVFSNICGPFSSLGGLFYVILPWISLNKRIDFLFSAFSFWASSMRDVSFACYFNIYGLVLNKISSLSIACLLRL